MIAAAVDEPLIGAAFVAGSVFPDLDVFFMLLGKRFYLLNHQGLTHSVILAPVYALLLSLPLFYLPASDWSLAIFLAALAGLVIHITLDWFNTFRVMLFSPFSKKRFSLDAVFFIDGVILFLTAMFYVFYGYYDIELFIYIYPLIFASYFIVKLILQKKIKAILKADYVIPSALNPMSFYVLTKISDSYNSYLYNSYTKKKSNEKNYIEVDEKYMLLANQSQIFEDIKSITRSLQITDVIENDKGTEIHAADLAVRNFGGRFAKTVLKFNKNNTLIHESSNI